MEDKTLFTMQNIESPVFPTPLREIAGITIPQINYSPSVGGKDAPDSNADKTSDHPQGVSWLTDAGDMAYEDLVEKAKLGTTVIDGGYIKTDLLTADNIVTGTMNAARINGGDINGVTITGVTITGATIRTNDANYPYVNINSSGIQVAGQSVLNFITTSGLSSGWIGADSGQQLAIYNQYNNVIIGSGSGNVISQSNFIPSSNGSYNLGSSSYYWNNVYAKEILSNSDLSIDIPIGSGLIPTKNTNSCGSNSHYWADVYSSYYDFKDSGQYITYDSIDGISTSTKLKVNGDLTCSQTAITLGNYTFYVYEDPDASGKYYLRTF